MCGITGYKKFTQSVDLNGALNNAVQSLASRGPDYSKTFSHAETGLGHTRLSIIDTSDLGHQPMSDHSGRYTLVFNGEIYNFKELRLSLTFQNFKSTTDTEVLLYLLIEKGTECLEELNGFFAFAFYDSLEQSLLIVRDRMGIKPLHYYFGTDFFAFGSEMKALLNYPIPREINQQALHQFLQLTYLPYDLSMIKGIKKLLPGHYLLIKNQNIKIASYWSLSTPVNPMHASYDDSKKEVVRLLKKSVEKRMIADVPLGSFLSGGTDSSAVVAMASEFNPNLHTFSIGYTDHSYFDETHYAELVAKRFNTNHTTFSLSNDDLLNHLQDAVGYLDEPFADSSALPSFILSKHVSKSMKVALSGDGADELFGGYYKHLAFVKSQKTSLINFSIEHFGKILTSLPQSRSSKAANFIRRVSKYSELLHLNTPKLYWRLASFNPEADKYLNHPSEKYEDVPKDEIDSLRKFLDLDLGLVLPGDMLTKVDLMSMANGLEVRVPFLDKDLVAYVRGLPDEYKINGNHRKRVLQDAFEHILPHELHHRSKKGFEVPMLSWIRNELNSEINYIVFNRDFLQSQGIFNVKEVFNLKRQLQSNNPGDVHAIIWTIYVFQKWYLKYIQS